MVDDIIFVKTRYHYDSYTDFWKLVELSGFPTCYVDEIDVHKFVLYIVTPMNGEVEPHIRNRSNEMRMANIVLWNLERPSGSNGMGQYINSNRRLIYERIVDDVWVSDRRIANESGFRFAVLGSDYGLGDPGDKKMFDFCHMSYVVPRRQTIYSNFFEHQIGKNCWGEERNSVLRLSKFALNIHQDQYPFQEPLRFALFAAYGLPILTETILDSYPWSDEFMVYEYYDDIAAKLRRMLKEDYSVYQSMAMNARDRMCRDFQFGKMVRQTVQESLG